MDCDGAFYSKAYGIIAGCTPPGGSKKGRRCRRAVTDNFASEDDSSELVQATEAAMVSLFHRGCVHPFLCAAGRDCVVPRRRTCRAPYALCVQSDEAALRTAQEVHLFFAPSSGPCPPPEVHTSCIHRAAFRAHR